MTDIGIEHLVQAIKESMEQTNELISSSVLISRSDAINTIRKVMGDSYLRFLLNLDLGEDVAEALLGVPQDQIQKLMRITVLLTPILLEQPDSSTLHGTLCRCFGSNLTLQEEFRVLNGGAPLPRRKTGDLLCDNVLESVQRIVPTLCIKEWGSGNGSGSRIDRLMNYLQDDMDQFESIVQKEQCFHGLGIELETFCPITDKQSEKKQSICLLTEAFPLLPFDSLSLRKGLITSALYYANTLDFTQQEQMIAGVTRAISEFRTLFSLREIETIALVVFDGAIMTGNRRAISSSGVLRSPTEYEEKVILPSNIKNPLIFESKCKNRLTGKGELNKVFEADTEGPFASFDWYGKPQETIDFDSLFGGLHVLSQKIQVAMILASDDTDKYVPHICGNWMPITLSSVDFVFNLNESGLDFGPPKQPMEFSADAFITWFAALQSAPLPEIALSRLVEAFSDKRSTRDALVDLLIIVESLFGSSSEIVFKLSLCVAKLLAPTDEIIRREKYEEMKKAYDLRSKTVHGDKVKYTQEQKTEILNNLRSNVKLLLKILLTDRKDILSASQDERIKMIALS